jgi:hypothetical protein
MAFENYKNLFRSDGDPSQSAGAALHHNFTYIADKLGVFDSTLQRVGSANLASSDSTGSDSPSSIMTHRAFKLVLTESAEISSFTMRCKSASGTGPLPLIPILLSNGPTNTPDAILATGTEYDAQAFGATYAEHTFELSAVLMPGTYWLGFYHVDPPANSFSIDSALTAGGNNFAVTYSAWYPAWQASERTVWHRVASESFDRISGIESLIGDGLITTFLDNDGNTITVKNGLITAKTAP